MRRKERDWKVEYQRRIARALAKGLSRSQARGHAKANELPLGASRTPQEKLEQALKVLRRSGSQKAAAREVGISAERFRRFVRENNLAHRRGRTWELTDNRPRRVQVISRGRQQTITVAGFEDASLVGRHAAAVKIFLDSSDPSHLAPFQGESVLDRNGRRYPFETDPNIIYRLSFAGGEAFEDVYRLIN